MKVKMLLWFKSTEYGDDKDRVLRKSNGFYTYLTPDIANHIYKFERGYQKVSQSFGELTTMVISPGSRLLWKL